MNIFSQTDNIQYKNFIYSIIDNKIKCLLLTLKDINNITKDNKKIKNAIKFNKSITELNINTKLQSFIYTYDNYNQYYNDKYATIPKIIIWFLGYHNTLKVITINYIKIKYKSLKQIFKVLKFNSTLEKIEINCNLLLHNTKFLADFLEHNTTLKTLSFKDVIFEDSYNLAQGLTKNKTLLNLNLSNSTIKNIQFLSTSLTINNTIKYLNLENIFIKDKTLFKSLLKSFEKNKGLIQINLSFNGLNDYNLYELTNLIQHNTTLKYLDLSYNRITKINILLKALQNNNTLKIVNLQNNNFKIYNNYSKLKINNATIYK